MVNRLQDFFRNLLLLLRKLDFWFFLVGKKESKKIVKNLKKLCFFIKAWHCKISSWKRKITQN